MGADPIRKIIHYTWRPFLLSWLKKERSYTYHDIRLVVRPGVFHPGFFYSSVLMADFMKNLDLRGKKVLDLGAGSGLLGILAAKMGADAMAVDISNTAVDNTVFNAANNQVELKVYQSDLFKALSPEKFDIILVNPPYYKKDPATEAEFAWYCGGNLEYFRRLFMQAPAHLGPNAFLYMILSEDCDINGIHSIAASNHFVMKEVLRQKKWREYNYIFRVEKE